MVKLVQHSWLGGQLDYEMMGRQDVEKYRKGASLLKNFIPLKRGAIRKRPGTDFIKDITSNLGGSTNFRMLPFSYLKDNGFVIIFKNLGAFVVNNAGTVINVSGTIPYTASEVDDIGYVQCGDILYLAHANHPPACIEHTRSGATHAFAYKVMSINPISDGKPTIIGASVSKIAITSSYEGGTKTEEYRATAVYDGIETFPCDVYSGTGCDDIKSSNVKTTYAGTSYHLPWTESCKISLQIGVPTKTVNETTVLPEEVRIYRKEASCFGLVGYRKISESSISDIFFNHTLAYDGTSNPDYKNSDDTTTYTSSNSMVLQEAPSNERGVNGACWYFGGWAYVKMSSGIDHAFKIRIHLGGCYYTISNDGNTVTFDYKANKATGVRFILSKDNSGNKYDVSFPNTLTAGTDRTQTITKNEGESDEDFELRWRSAFKTFRNGTSSDEYYHDFAISNSNVDINYFQFSSTNNYLYLSGIEVIKTGAIRFDDDYITPDTSITPPDDTFEPIFTTANEYPSSVAIYQQRLVWASSNNDPARVWMSQIGEFSIYCPHQIQTADDSIDFHLPITRFAKLNHLVEMRALVAFSEACEWIIGSNSSASGVSYETIEAKPHSFLGSDGRLPPIVCNNAIIFAERTGQTVRRYGYQLEDDGYGGRDISIFSSSIFNEKQIVDWTYQQHPNPIIWCVLSDGTMAALLFMEDAEQKICAWSTHTFAAGEVKAVATSHALVGRAGGISDTSETFIIVKRGNNYILERFRPFPKMEADSVQNMVTMDSVRSLSSGASIPSGMTAVDKVTGETITTVGANGAWCGYEIEALMQSVYPAISDEDIGASHFDIKNIQNVSLRLINSVGGSIRSVSAPSASVSQFLSFDDRLNLNVTDGIVSTPKIDVRGILTGVNDRDGRVIVNQTNPWPFMIVMMETDIAVEAEGQG